MAFNIPEGWHQIKGVLIEAGDKIKSSEGWAEVENLGPSRITAVRSAIGHPTALYECVIRKNPVKTKKAKRAKA